MKTDYLIFIDDYDVNNLQKADYSNNILTYLGLSEVKELDEITEHTNRNSDKGTL